MEETVEQMTAKVLEEYDREEKSFYTDFPELPSAFQPQQVVRLVFREGDKPFIATVRGVHFYMNKVKYDLGLWLGDGSVDNPEYETRIYNVDSAFLTAA